MDEHFDIHSGDTPGAVFRYVQGAVARPQEFHARTSIVMSRPEVIFFDVNETLLDLGGMRSSVSDALRGRDDLLPLWFSKMLHYSLVSNDINNYRHFGDIGVAALLMVAKNNEIELSEENARKAIVTPLRNLPPHPDVRPALEKLEAAGIRMVTFTNSSHQGVGTQMENADLKSFFEKMLSIEDMQLYKPDVRSYAWALKQMEIEPQDALMVAAHGWDVAGAKAAGMQAAFIARPGKSLYPLSTQPDYVVEDFGELVKLLIGNDE